ncbi:unnamed protein product [Schistosoma rodhaini]|nr:unnamed protein product [Schistosoma rodhaini]
MDQIIWIMWISLLLYTGENYTDADKLIQSSLTTSYIMKNVQYSIYNQTVIQGEQITLHCIPDLNTNFIIWYFTPMVTMGNNNNFKGLSMSNRNDTSMNETITETIELAVCKPNVTCKEQYHLVNLQVQSNGILTITNIQSYHSGNYQCAMLAGVKTITMNRYLIVQAPPSKPSITVNTHSTAEKLFKLSKESNNDTYIIEGEYLDLICQSEKGLPSPQIVWSFLPMENTTITSMKLEVSQDINYNIHESLQRNENTRSSMYIPTIVPYGNTSSHFRLKVSRSHDGMRIVCEAVNRIGSSISEPYVISVRYAPVILQFPDEPWIVLYEEPSTTVCHAVGNPKPTIYWIDQYGKRISKTEQLNSAILNKEVIFNDELGRFSKNNWRMNVTCYAENTMGSIKKSLIIEYYFAPIIKTNDIIYAYNNESIQLTCDAISNPPPINIFWYRRSNKITSSSSSSSTSSSSSSSSSSKSSSPSSTSSSNLINMNHIHHSDLFQSISSISKYSTNYNLTNDHFYWFSPILKINSITIDDHGIYVCVVENRIHLKAQKSFIYRRESETQLLVYYPPGKPTIQKISNPQIDENITIVLQCILNDKLPGLPIPSIEWLWSPKSCKTAIKSKSNNLMTPIPYKSKFSEYKDQLLINLTDTFMDGLYYCLVQNDNGNTLSDPVSITVQEEPQIIEQPNIDNVLNPSFNSIHKPYLRCVAYGKPAPQINWFHDNSIILTTSTSMNSITLGTLNDIHCSWRKILTTIKCIEFDTGSYTWETTSQLIWGYNQSFNHNLYNECYSYHLMNEGSYTCQAINNFGYDYSNPVHITLKYPPTLLHQSIIKQTINTKKISQKSINFFSNSIINKLTCIFKSYPIPKQIIWYYINTYQYYNTIYNNYLSNISSFIKQKLCNQHVLHHQFIKILSNYNKTNNLFSNHGNNRTNDNYYIQLLSGYKAKLALLDYININMTYYNSLYLTHLIINQLKSIKFGIYLSLIINDEGCQQCIILLQNYSTPETPTDIEIKEITWDKLTLSWIPGFDGGYEQTIVIEFLKVFNKDQLTPVNNLPKSVFINHVPRLPIYQQCQISGLTPNTVYTFVIYGKNYLGHGKLSKQYTITTKEFIFPKLNINYHHNNLIHLNFSHSNQSKFYCLKTEFLQKNTKNWSTAIDTCQTHQKNQLLFTENNNNISNHFSVTIATIPFMNNNGGIIDNQLKLRNNDRKLNQSLIEYNLSLQQIQANSDDPNSLKIMKTIKDHRKRSLVLQNLTQNDIVSNQSIHNEYKNHQSSIGVKFHKDHNLTYRIWICLRNQTRICHQEKLFFENSISNSNLWNVKSIFIWITIIILIVTVCICIIFIIHYIKRHHSNHLPTLPFIHEKDKFSIQSNHNSLINMNKLNGSLPQSNQNILNTISNEVDMKLSTSNLTISESNYSTSSTILPITYDITTNHNHIPTVLSFQSDMPNSMKSSTIEFTPTLYEYKPTSISYYPNLINNQYNITSTCSLIPLNNSSNNTDSLLSISKCIVDTSSIIIIPANTIDFQCTN